jgi:hypothetical protein
MSRKWVVLAGAMLLVLASTISAIDAIADERSDYSRRAAARDLRLFHELDRNGDGAVTRLEARGDVNFLPRFNDMEVDMDGVVTATELHRYLEQHYGVR